jgi:hypothetical protein
MTLQVASSNLVSLLNRKGLAILLTPFCTMAGATRLELATFGVTGRRSNQLNYAPAYSIFNNSKI